LKLPPGTQRPRARRVLSAAVLAVVLHAAPATAIDLLQSYQLALLNDGQLKVAKARADQGREALPQATAQLWPYLSFSYAYGQTDQTRSLGSVSDSQQYPSKNAIIQVRQPIYRGLLLSQLNEARSKVEGVNAQLETDTQATGIRVIGAYFDALFARDSLTLIDAQKASYIAQLRAAGLALSAGTGTRTDIDEIQARYDLLLADEIRVRQGIDASTQQLEVFIGERATALSPLDAEVFHAEDFDPATLDKWLSAAEQSNPDVRALKARYDAAVAAIKGAQAGHYPTLDLVAQYQDQTGDSTSTLPRSDNRVGYVGLQLNVPIFAGGYVNSQVRQATAAADEAREAYEYARDDLRLRVKREFDGLKAGISRSRALEVALKSGDQMVRSNQKGVQAGTRTTLDVLTAEQQRFNTRLDLAKARYQLLGSWATLLSYAGDLNTEQIARINRVLKDPVPTTM
jgi:protease secretion system outer membrane protein